MNKTILKDTLKLVVITLVAALLLALVFQLTKDTIAQAKAAERLASYESVMSDATGFNAIDSDYITDWNKNNPGAEIGEAYVALKGEEVIGTVVSVTSHNGYGGDIVLTLGVDTSGVITGVKVTSMGETSGLGAHCTDEDWIAQFSGKQSGVIGYVKNGNPGDDEIDAITGATITTKAVLEAVNQGSAFISSYNSLGGEQK